MPVAASAVPPTLCPLCGRSNECSQERERATGIPQGPCWCTQVRFDAAQLARVPAQAKNLACLCPACARGAAAARPAE